VQASDDMFNHNVYQPVSSGSDDGLNQHVNVLNVIRL